MVVKHLDWMNLRAVPQEFRSYRLLDFQTDESFKAWGDLEVEVRLNQKMLIKNFIKHWLRHLMQIKMV